MLSSSCSASATARGAAWIPIAMVWLFCFGVVWNTQIAVGSLYSSGWVWSVFGNVGYSNVCSYKYLITCWFTDRMLGRLCNAWMGTNLGVYAALPSGPIVIVFCSFISQYLMDCPAHLKLKTWNGRKWQTEWSISIREELASILNELDVRSVSYLLLVGNCWLIVEGKTYNK